MSTAPVITGHEITSHTATDTTEFPLFDAHDKQYLLVALGLAAMTAIEVTLSYTSLKHAALALPLLALAGIKFIVVAGFFMHLKNDSPVFRRLFIMGSVLAVFCYTAVLSIVGQFQGGMQWVIFVAFAVVLIAVWALRGLRPADSGDAHDHDHGDHSHGDHSVDHGVSSH